MTTRPTARRVRAHAGAGRGSTRVAPSSSPPPWPGHFAGRCFTVECEGPSRWAAASPTGRPGRRRPRRPHDRWRVRPGETTFMSCAPQPVDELGRLGEPHRDRKVARRGPMPRPDQTCLIVELLLREVVSTGEPETGGPWRVGASQACSVVRSRLDRRDARGEPDIEPERDGHWKERQLGLAVRDVFLVLSRSSIAGIRDASVRPRRAPSRERRDPDRLGGLAGLQLVRSSSFGPKSGGPGQLPRQPHRPSAGQSRR